MFRRNKVFSFLFIISFLLIPFHATKADLGEDLAGYILLQVEEHGEAWYVYPEDHKRYYLGLAEDAFAIMRDKGLGIAHAELERYLNSFFPLRLAGMILLDVEANGEAYYVYPGDLQGYFLGRPADAYGIMRDKGLGITNKNLSEIDSDAGWDVWVEEKIGTGAIVDTGQSACYSSLSEMNCREEGGLFFGQDAQYEGRQAKYQDNDDGTVTDLNTGLTWVKTPGEKTDYYSAMAEAESMDFAWYDDWRVPTIKELYSLINFSGMDPAEGSTVENSTPFIDTDYFDFEYGDEIAGERLIDSQWITSNVYKSTVMRGQECFFGVNFADGRIKCYGTKSDGYGMNNGHFVRYVRGYSYGENAFSDNGDGTIYDQNSGLTWTQADSGEGYDWEDALGYCENLELAGKTDWRLPNAKELQNIVDYSRSPDTSDSAAINPVFSVTGITNEAGQVDYPFYWTSTTHVRYPDHATAAAYISFGRAMGNMNGWIDVHGAGAQRSDTKSGDPSEYNDGRGPQGDAVRIENYVRCVRGGAKLVEVASTVSADDEEFEIVEEPIAPVAPVTPPPPPMEAVIACYGRSLNMECSFNGGKGFVYGTCAMIGEDMACRP